MHYWKTTRNGLISLMMRVRKPSSDTLTLPYFPYYKAARKTSGVDSKLTATYLGQGAARGPKLRRAAKAAR